MRLTQRDDQGNWCLRGVLWNCLYPGQEISPKLYEKLYGALWKLVEYEDTGLTPEEITDGKMMTRWIPVEEKLPECEKEVLIQTQRGTITTAMYEDGKMPNDDSCWCWTDIDFDYDEETDTNYIPAGWWEYRHFNPDDVYNNAVDETVIAWMPRPESYRPETVRETF